MHGGGPKVAPGRPSPRPTRRRTLALLEKGSRTWSSTSRRSGSSACPSWWPSTASPRTRTPRWTVARKAAERPAPRTPRHLQPLGRGRQGAVELAKAVVAACDKTARKFEFLYPARHADQGEDQAIATKVYGADGRAISTAGREQIAAHELGPRQAAHLHGQDAPFALARSAAQGRAHGLHRAGSRGPPSVGAGFLYPLLGTMHLARACPAARPSSTSTSTPAAKSSECFSDCRLTSFDCRLNCVAGILPACSAGVSPASSPLPLANSDERIADGDAPEACPTPACLGAFSSVVVLVHFSEISVISGLLLRLLLSLLLTVHRPQFRGITWLPYSLFAIHYSLQAYSLFASSDPRDSTE